MRPSRDEVLMATAELVSARSTCSRARVGVVIAREGRQLTSGYNGAPAGLPHCNHECGCGAGAMTHHERCPAVSPCGIAVHAEANAIAYAARYGMALEGSELFTTLSPCIACSQLIINAGITRVVYAKEYRDRSGLTLLLRAGIVVGE